MDKLEKKDAWIGAGLLALLLILYFAHKTTTSSVVDTGSNLDTPATAETSTTGPPSYNMPPTLTLPPFNVGNTSNNSPNTDGNNCSCQNNACHSSQNGVVDYATMLDAWNPISSTNSIVAPHLEAATPLPTPATITAPAPAPLNIAKMAHTYADWYAQATQTGIYTPTNRFTGQSGTGLYASKSNIPPGLTQRQIYFLYQQVNGNYLSVLGQGPLNSAVAAAYASPA